MRQTGRLLKLGWLARVAVVVTIAGVLAPALQPQFGAAAFVSTSDSATTADDDLVTSRTPQAEPHDCPLPAPAPDDLLADDLLPDSEPEPDPAAEEERASETETEAEPESESTEAFELTSWFGFQGVRRVGALFRDLGLLETRSPQSDPASSSRRLVHPSRHLVGDGPDRLSILFCRLTC